MTQITNLTYQNALGRFGHNHKFEVAKFLSLSDILRWTRSDRGVMSPLSIQQSLLERTSLTWTEFEYLRKTCPDQFLSETVTKIGRFSRITAGDLKQLAKCFPNLQHLDLWGNDNLTDVDLEHIRSLPLKYLNLAYCNNITEHGLTYLREMPLEHFNLSGSLPVISTQGFTNFRKWPLRHLDLHQCWKITNAGLGVLKDKELEFLRINCSKLVDLTYLENMPLEHLELDDARNIFSFHPLRRMPLKHLKISRLGLPIHDWIFLRDLPLRYLELQGFIPSTEQFEILRDKPLDVLMLHFCRISADHLRQIQRMKIDRLSLFCSTINDETLSFLEDTSFKELNLNSCQITANKLREFIINHPQTAIDFHPGQLLPTIRTEQRMWLYLKSPRQPIVLKIIAIAIFLIPIIPPFLIGLFTAAASLKATLGMASTCWAGYEGALFLADKYFPEPTPKHFSR